MANEVAARIVTDFLTVAERRGVATTSLLQGLAVERRALYAPGARVDWTDLHTFMDRLESAAGGPHALEDLAGEVMTSSLAMRTLGRLCVSPRMIYLHVSPRMNRSAYTCCTYRADELPDGRIRLTARFLPGYTTTRSMLRASVGGVRAFPRILGQPDAVVDGSFAPDHIVMMVTLPPSNTLAARAARALGALGDVYDDRALDDLEVVIDSSARNALACELGQRLALHRDLGALVDDLFPLLRERFLCGSAALWLRRPDGSLSLAHQAIEAGSTPNLCRSLAVDGREVGRLEVDLAPAEADPGSLFDLLVPWIAIALDRCAAGAAAAEPGKLARAGAEWQLTTRQAQVLELLSSGLANKEIARALGTSLKTVEAHMSQLLHRAGAGSRTELLSRVWGPGPLPRVLRGGG